MNPQVKSDRENVPMASSTMRALSSALCTWCQTLHITDKDHESVPANAHIVELATIVQILMILKTKTRCPRF